jgi:phytanoyl-CoA hydroxylase
MPSSSIAEPVETYSRFGGLWIDRKDSEAMLAERQRSGMYSSALADKISTFMRDGFIILKGAVSKHDTAALRAELDAFWESPAEGALVETYEVPGATGVQLAKPKPEYKYGTTKLLDYHAFSNRMRRAVANPQAVEFLAAIFETKPKAFQGLTFWRGSQQAIHKDTAYVRVDGEPMHLAASWLALEDVSAGVGELEYFIGSHRAPDFLFGGHSKWHIDAPEDDPKFLQSLHDDAQKYGYKKGSFLASEGDVLIWHADLAHGGGQITRPGQSRQSHVTHFTTANDDPPYMRGITRKVYEQNGCLFLSGHREIGD